MYTFKVWLLVVFYSKKLVNDLQFVFMSFLAFHILNIQIGLVRRSKQYLRIGKLRASLRSLNGINTEIPNYNHISLILTVAMAPYHLHSRYGD